MQKADLQKKKLPSAPGVYFFLGSRKEVLYIGKATSLKDRVKSYFAKDLSETRGAQIVRMVEEAKSIDYRESDSVLEALILEANLIKTYKPKYNTLLKDDKSYNYVVITKEEWPRVLKVRGKDLYQKFKKSEIKKLFGPFPHGGQLSEALKIIRKIFPFFDTKKPITEAKSKMEMGKLAFYQSLGIYPESSKEAKAAYQRTIRHISLFFQGKKSELLRELERDMHKAAKSEQFEQAESFKRQIFALGHIRDVSLIKHETREEHSCFVRIEAYDIAHTSGEEMVGVMTVVENGEMEKAEYRKFTIRGYTKANDTGALKEILRRRFKHYEWRMPTLIVLDGGKAQLAVGQKVLEEYGYMVPVVSVVKDERHRPREILGVAPKKQLLERDIIKANAEAHRFAIEWHRKRLRQR